MLRSWPLALADDQHVPRIFKGSGCTVGRVAHSTAFIRAHRLITHDTHGAKGQADLLELQAQLPRLQLVRVLTTALGLGLEEGIVVLAKAARHQQERAQRAVGAEEADGMCGEAPTEMNAHRQAAW